MSGSIPPRPDAPREGGWTAAPTKEAVALSHYGSPPVGLKKTGIVLSLLALGLATDLVTRGLPGVGIPLVAISGSLLIVAVARPRRAGLLLLALAAIFTVPVAARADPRIATLDVGAALALAVLAASYAQGGSPMTDGIRAWVRRGVGILGATRPGLAFFSPRPGSLRTDKAGRIVRTTMIAGAILLVFGVVLASADAVFARLVTTPLRWDLGGGDVIQHAARTAFLAVAAAVLLAYADGKHASKQAASVEIGLSLVGWEWVTILGSVCGLFAVFVIIQFEYLFGGAGRVRSVPGLSYAEYARSGFAQMMLAAGMSLGLIALGWVAWPRENTTDRRAFAVLAGTLLGLNLLVLASAFKRLTLYEGAYGWTFTRILAHTIILWMSGVIVFALLGVVLAKGRWVVPAATGLGLAALMALNVINVGAFIADRNLDRYHATGKLDVAYLSSLSEDAVPRLVEALPTLPRGMRSALATGLRCNHYALADQPATSWNLGRERALSSLASVGIQHPGSGEACYSDAGSFG